MVERKLATVLFVDLVDSTRMVTASDPGGRPAPRQHSSSSASPIASRSHGGIVEKFAGDAVLAAFGVPQSHEDDALRAARAAVAMREAVAELDLEARIGIEAGELVVDEAESSFVTGEAVNLAARLQQVAMPGEILIGPTAYRLAAGGLVVEDAGPLELKGLDAPARAWRVIGVLDGGARPAGRGRRSSEGMRSSTCSRTRSRARCGTAARTCSRSTASPA